LRVQKTLPGRGSEEQGSKPLCANKSVNADEKKGQKRGGNESGRGMGRPYDKGGKVQRGREIQVQIPPATVLKGVD